MADCRTTDGSVAAAAPARQRSSGVDSDRSTAGAPSLCSSTGTRLALCRHDACPMDGHHRGPSPQHCTGPLARPPTAARHATASCRSRVICECSPALQRPLRPRPPCSSCCSAPCVQGHGAHGGSDGDRAGVWLRTPSQTHWLAARFGGRPLQRRRRRASHVDAPPLVAVPEATAATGDTGTTGS